MRPSLATVAQTVGVHPMHLARTFRAHVGCSVGAFVRRVRVELACRVLRETDQSLSEIALRAGFADQSHFSRVFRRLTGMTPGRYRAKRPGARGRRSHG